MKSTKLKGALSISKTSTGVIAVTIEDETSGIEFARLEMKPADFANALTGRHGCLGALDIKGLRHVGKKKEVERVKLRLSEKHLKRLHLNPYDKDQLERYLVKSQQKEGWLLNPYLGSQSSVVWQNKDIVLNFSYTRYVRA